MGKVNFNRLSLLLSWGDYMDLIIYSSGDPKTVGDPEGRFLAPNLQVFQSIVIIVNTYAPNLDSKPVFLKIIPFFETETAGTIWTGDCNIPLAVRKDRQSCSVFSRRRDPKMFTAMIAHHDLLDTWCYKIEMLHYTLWSKKNRMHARID